MRGQTNASNIGGSIGSDTKPIKIVNGVATAVTNDLALNSAVVHKTGYEVISDTKVFQNDLARRIQNLASRSDTNPNFIASDIRFIAENGDELAILRFQQYNGGRGLIVGLSDVNGNFTWTNLATIPL